MDETRFAVLGGGLVGGFIARQLADQPHCHVTLADINGEVLSRCAQWSKVLCLQTDLTSPAALASAINTADVVIGAVPGNLGYRTLEGVIDAGKPVVDISFFPEDPLRLDAMARERGVTAVVDCGVMPGLGGMIAMDFAQQFDEPLRLRIMVGGLPAERRWPLEYRAPFSPIDVIEEYLRPARLMQGGHVIERPALSDVEQTDLPGVDTLEAFNTDGLRSLLNTLPFPDMAEKTLRYPGTAEKMRMLRELGFFSSQCIQVGGQSVRPLDVTARLLFKAWELRPGMAEFTVMRVCAEGLKRGRMQRLVCDMLDRTDQHGQFSMARTTGLPAVLIALQLAQRRLPAGPGIILPETLARDAALRKYLYAGLARHGGDLNFTAHDAGKG
jgi:lysine 6-dehydrogenase